MAARYELKGCSLRSGLVTSFSLPLTNTQATCAIETGEFGADLRLPMCAPDDPRRAKVLDQCRDLLAATTPVMQTVLVIRDGKIMGEWMLWTRDLSKTPVPLTGQDLTSWFKERAAVDGFPVLKNVDQLNLAYRLLKHAADKPLAPAMTVADPGTSGNIVPEANYPTGSEYVGKIVDELGAELNGFDWWVDTEWDPASPLAKVKRTVRLANPRRGRTLQARIDVPATSPGQSGVAYGQLEDGMRIATTVYMTGTGEGDTQLVARGRNNDLLQSYPPLDYIDSRADYDDQKLLDAQANAVAAAGRSVTVPATVRVRADGDLALGDYEPGDTVPLKVEPTFTYPDGVTTKVRIVSFTLQPPVTGGTEMVDVTIESGDASDLDF